MPRIAKMVRKRQPKMSPKSDLVREEETPSYGKASPEFLALEDVLGLHTRQIERYGGTDGIRDKSLLLSAIAQPGAGFGGQWLHEDVFEMAAAYAFHLCQNHPFFDGNKRTALETALVFLEINGVCILDPKKKLIEVMLSVAEGKMNKKELAQAFCSLPRS